MNKEEKQDRNSHGSRSVTQSRKTKQSWNTPRRDETDSRERICSTNVVRACRLDEEGIIAIFLHRYRALSLEHDSQEPASR